MKQIVIVIPEWVRVESAEDVLRQRLPALSRIAELGKLLKISKLPMVECREALILGIPPGVAELRQGPLTISALGADPPERSTHFHLSLLEHRDGRLLTSTLEPTEVDLRKISELASKLNTKTLTFVPGEKRDHGLVWEALGDLRTFSPSEAEGKEMRSILPDGDGDPQLRRYIDDSVNLLSELELNVRRFDEDLPLMNLLWPWGNGMRTAVPNLALKRGQPSTVISDSMRLQGLARLAGYQHVDRRLYRSGLQFDLKRAAELAARSTSSIIFLRSIESLISDEQTEERAWFTKQIDEILLSPLLDLTLTEDLFLTLLAPSSTGVGLGVQLESKVTDSNPWPFDHRTLDEKQVPTQTLWESVSAALN